MSLEKGKCYNLRDLSTGHVEYLGEFNGQYNNEAPYAPANYVRTFINRFGDEKKYFEQDYLGKEFVVVPCRPTEDVKRVKDLVVNRCYKLEWNDTYAGHFLGTKVIRTDGGYGMGERSFNKYNFDTVNCDLYEDDQRRLFVEVDCQTNSSSSSSAAGGGSAAGGSSAAGGGSAAQSRISTLEQRLAADSSAAGGGSAAQSRISTLEQRLAAGSSAAGGGSAAQSRISILEQQIAQLQEELRKEKSKLAKPNIRTRRQRKTRRHASRRR